MQTLSQGYKQRVESLFKLSNMMNPAQRALMHWAIVDDYHALLELSCPNVNLLHSFMEKYRVRACGLVSTAAQTDRYADQLPDAEWIRGDAADIPWQDGSFHTVFLSSPPETSIGEKEVLRDIYRVLREDGCFLAAVPFFGQETSLFSFYRRKELTDCLHDVGFSDVSFRLAGFGYLTLVARRESA